MALAYGPVPSRRLGKSLGINNIPPKFCSYSCVYCQLGNTLKVQVHRTSFYKPEALKIAVLERIKRVRTSGGEIDCLTFVPDGEPTIDQNLGKEIDLLKETGIDVAVITNSSLLWMEQTRSDLVKADWVSLKIDTMDPHVWRTVNRPDPDLDFDRIKEGISIFAKEFKGTLATETMLVSGLNDGEETIAATSRYIGTLEPSVSYISVPIRPPAEEWVKPPSEDVLNRAYQIYSEQISRVEFLTEYEGNEFAYTGDIVSDIMGIVLVHPMRREALVEMLSKAGEDWEVIDRLLSNGQLLEVSYRGIKFYMRPYRDIG